MKRVMRDAPNPLVEQSQATRAKRRDFGFSIGRSPFPKEEWTIIGTVPEKRWGFHPKA